MRKYLLLLLTLMLALACTAAAEDEEVSITDVLNNAHPDVVEKTIVQPPTEEEIAAIEAASIYEPDGSVLITLSAGGDVQLGGALYEEELAKYAGDPAFVLRNIRETLLADDMTILSLETAPADSAAALAGGGVDAVTLANDIMQASDETVRQELRQAFETSGVTCVDAGEIAVREVKGVKIAGMVFGKFSYDCKMTADVITKIVRSKKQLQNVPVIFNADFGHVYPQFTFPFGGTAKLSAKGKKASIEILKH